MMPDHDIRLAPLVTVDVDISGLDGFMLNVQRLFASELWALSTGDEFKAALALWGRAWQQSPPGSLPNEDRVLAAFSGAGKDWKKIRGMALRGFLECSDGRLYHRVLCEDVLNAHRKRQAFRDRTRNATEAPRRNEGRDDQRNERRDKIRNDQRSDHRDVVDDANVTSVQGQGQGQKKEAFSLCSKDAPPNAPPTEKPALRSASPRTHPFPPDAFERWYGGYPHKIGRAAAAKAFAKVQASDKISFDMLVSAVDRYRTTKPPAREWCNPATWLNQARWADEPAASGSSVGISPTSNRTSEPLVDLGGGLMVPRNAIRIRWGRRSWDDQWGPTPDHPGCRIPPEIMATIMDEKAAA